jgi:hypothetical protein
MEILERKIHEADLMENRRFYRGYTIVGEAAYDEFPVSVMHLSLEKEVLTVTRPEKENVQFTMEELSFIRDFLDEVKK